MGLRVVLCLVIGFFCWSNVTAEATQVQLSCTAIEEKVESLRAEDQWSAVYEFIDDLRRCREEGSKAYSKVYAIEAYVLYHRDAYEDVMNVMVRMRDDDGARDTKYLGYVSDYAAISALSIGRASEALPLLETASLFSKERSPDAQVHVQNAIVTASMALGRFGRAEQAIERARSIIESESISSRYLIKYHLEASNLILQKGLHHGSDSIGPSGLRDMKSHITRADSLIYLNPESPMREKLHLRSESQDAGYRILTGDFDQAVLMYKRLVDQSDRIGSVWDQVLNRINLARVYSSTGRYKEAYYKTLEASGMIEGDKGKPEMLRALILSLRVESAVGMQDHEKAQAAIGELAGIEIPEGSFYRNQASIAYANFIQTSESGDNWGWALLGGSLTALGILGLARTGVVNVWEARRTADGSRHDASERRSRPPKRPSPSSNASAGGDMAPSRASEGTAPDVTVASSKPLILRRFTRPPIRETYTPGDVRHGDRGPYVRYPEMPDPAQDEPEADSPWDLIPFLEGRLLPTFRDEMMVFDRYAPDGTRLERMAVPAYIVATLLHERAFVVDTGEDLHLLMRTVPEHNEVAATARHDDFVWADLPWDVEAFSVAVITPQDEDDASA